MSVEIAQVQKNVRPGPDESVLFDDWFETGTCGWQQLLSGGFAAPYGVYSPVGPVGLVAWPTLNGGYALEWHSEDAEDTGSPYGEATAIKRVYLPDASQPAALPSLVIGLDYWFTYNILHYGTDCPRAFDFGLDTAIGSGVRSYFKFRCFLNDGSGQWQMGSGASPGVFTAIPNSSGLMVAINENKCNWNRVTVYFDIVNGVYAGLKVNGNSFGTFLGAPALPSAAGVNEPINEGVLATFANGMNATIDIRNRTDTVNSKTWAYLGRARGVIAG